MTRNHSYKKGEFSIYTNPKKMDAKAIHHYLCNESDWSQGIPLSKVERSIQHSLNFGIFKGKEQIGYAKVITDFTTIAYIGDLYVLWQLRGLGLASWLMGSIMSHPELQGMRRWILLTNSAPWLYKKFGFTALEEPKHYMEKRNPNAYENI